MKWDLSPATVGSLSRAPHGARGLLLHLAQALLLDFQVAPRTGRVD